MKFLAGSLVVLLVFCSVKVASAEGMPDSLREHIENHFIGEWATEFSHEGRTFKGEYSAKWAPGKQCVIIKDKSTSLSGEGDDFGTGILGWDPRTKSVVHHEFLSNGDHFTIRYTETEGQSWTGEITGLYTGKPMKSPAQVDWKGDSFEYRDRTLGSPFVMKGVRQSSAMVLNEQDFKEFSEMLEGRWVGDVTWVTDWPGVGKRGEKATCYADFTMRADGQALLGKFFVGAGSQQVLWLFDAGAKKIRGTSIDSGGTVDHLTYYKRDGKWVELGEGSLADGTKTKYKGTFRIEDNGRKLVATGSGTVGGKPHDDRHDVWRKVSK